MFLPSTLSLQSASNLSCRWLLAALPVAIQPVCSQQFIPRSRYASTSGWTKTVHMSRTRVSQWPWRPDTPLLMSRLRFMNAKASPYCGSACCISMAINWMTAVFCLMNLSCMLLNSSWSCSLMSQIMNPWLKSHGLAALCYFPATGSAPSRRTWTTTVWSIWHSITSTRAHRKPTLTISSSRKPTKRISPCLAPPVAIVTSTSSGNVAIFCMLAMINLCLVWRVMSVCCLTMWIYRPIVSHEPVVGCPFLHTHRKGLRCDVTMVSVMTLQWQWYLTFTRTATSDGIVNTIG